MATFLYGILILGLVGSVWGQAFVNQYPYYQQPSYGIEAYRYINPYLLRQYHSAQDFYATSRQDLDRKVQDAVQLMNEVRQNMNNLLLEARNRGDTYLQNALYRIDTASQDLTNFERQLSVDRTTPFPQLQIDWQNRVQSLYDNGLAAITRSAEMWNTGTKLHTSLLLCLLLALTVLFAGFM